MAKRPSLSYQLDCIRQTGDYVEFDKEFTELGSLLHDTSSSHRSEPSSTPQQDAHLNTYYKFIKSYDKYLRVKDTVTNAVLQDAAFPLEFVKLEKQLTLFLAWVHKHAEPSAHAGLIPEDGTLAQYWSSMLFWSVRISRERGVEPPSHGRLNSALTQATQLLESRGEQHAGQKREDDIHDNDAKDTLSDAGAKPRIKRTKTQSSQAGVLDPANIHGAIVTDPESILAYFAAHPIPGSRSVTVDEVMQYFVDNPPAEARSMPLDEALQYFVDNPIDGTRMATMEDTQAWLDADREQFMRKRVGVEGVETQGAEENETEAEDDDEFEGFSD